MRKLIAALATGAILIGTPASALAEEAIEATTAPTRVVIAPALTNLARIIKAGLSSSYYGADPDSRAYRDAQKLYFFYGARAFEPLWLAEGPDGKPTFAPRALSIIEVFKDAAAQGFRPEDYLTPELDIAAAGDDPVKLAALETAFSESALRYAQHAAGGRIRPQDVGELITIKPRQINPAEMLVELAGAPDPAAVLMNLHPRQPEFLRLREALANFDDSVVDDQIRIPDGPLLKKGMRDERVALLRQRLNVAPPEVAESATNATDDNIYDDALVAAVKEFQKSLDLIADGIVGPATVAALNGGGGITREDIIANMERWRWLAPDLGDFYVMVNVPEFRLYVEKRRPDGQDVDVTYTTRVITGKPDRQTPIFSDEIENIVVNPYWNVPARIARNEIAPLIRANPGYLASQNMEMLSASGKVINASAIDWSTTNVNSFRIRQRPGAGNALGKIKFLFPNEHDVYMHDTPSKQLFNSAIRAYSHGCVRVQNPMEFAEALLANEPKLTVAMLEDMVGGGEKWNTLDTHVPVHIVYFTLRVDPDGTIRSYGDIYGHNRRMIELLSR